MDKKTQDDSGEPVSKTAIGAMIAILIGLILVSVYANWQNVHRGQIESVEVTRFTPAPSPSASPTR
jgi:hypothetical protein